MFGENIAIQLVELIVIAVCFWGYSRMAFPYETKDRDWEIVGVSAGIAVVGEIVAHLLFIFV